MFGTAPPHTPSVSSLRDLSNNLTISIPVGRYTKDHPSTSPFHPPAQLAGFWLVPRGRLGIDGHMQACTEMKDGLSAVE
jgi:hypothetical protein